MGQLIDFADYKKKKKNEHSLHNLFSQLNFYGSSSPIYFTDGSYSFSYSLITCPISLASVVEK